MSRFYNLYRRGRSTIEVQAGYSTEAKAREMGQSMDSDNLEWLGVIEVPDPRPAEVLRLFPR